MTQTATWSEDVGVSATSPLPKPFGVSEAEAVELCKEWMIFLGARDTVVASTALKLCDLYSSRYLGWVWNGRGNVPADVVGHAAEVSSADGRAGLLFVSGGLSVDARDTADHFGLAVFHFLPNAGTLYGSNASGRVLRGVGLQA
jgi:hypothetical protein